jgi:undecaprenyl-diphosphatase
MTEYLEEIDRQIVLAINGLHNVLLDEIMWWISARVTWIPLYLVLLYLAFKQLNRKQLFLFIAFVVASVAITDLVSVHLFKNIFLRYRPSHNLLISDQLHYYQIRSGEWYKGGQFGFVSSHAANYFAIATGSWLVLKENYPNLRWWLLVIGVLICFSRIYLGVHYLSDLIVGGIVGVFIAFGIYKLWFSPLIFSKNIS